MTKKGLVKKLYKDLSGSTYTYSISTHANLNISDIIDSGQPTQTYSGTIRVIGNHYFLKLGCREYIAHDMNEVLLYIKKELKGVFGKK